MKEHPAYAFDIDGTITAAPKAVPFLINALRAAGAEIHIVTATKEDKATDEDYAARKKQLADLGVEYDALYIAPTPIAHNKAKYLKVVDAVAFFDNRAKNAVEAADVTNSFLYLGYNKDDGSEDFHDHGG